MLVNGGCTDVEVDPNALTRTISIDSSHKGMMSSNIDPLSPSTNMLLSKRGYVGKFSSDEKTDAGDTAIGSTQTIKHNHDSIHPLQHQINVINFDE